MSFWKMARVFIRIRATIRSMPPRNARTRSICSVTKKPAILSELYAGKQITYPIYDEEGNVYQFTPDGNVEPFTTGFYVNDYFDHSQEQVNRTYRENFPRLLEIKKQYDPTNLFRLNANIRST